MALEGTRWPAIGAWRILVPCAAAALVVPTSVRKYCCVDSSTFRTIVYLSPGVSWNGSPPNCTVRLNGAP